MTTAKLRIAKLQQVELHWREDGDPSGRPVVFANSLGTDLRLWDAVIPLLPTDSRYIRFDKRGHGLSSAPAAPYSLQDLSADTEELLEQLDVQNCLFVGLSIGGMIGQLLASKRPDLIRALVLSNTAAKMGDANTWKDRIAAIEANGVESIAEAVLSRWFAPDFLSKPEVGVWRQMLCRTPQAGYLGCCHALANADLCAQTSELKLPVMGIAGSQDGASPAELVQATVNSIAGAQFHVMDKVGHLPCVENPSEYANLIKRFIKETAHA